MNKAEAWRCLCAIDRFRQSAVIAAGAMALLEELAAQNDISPRHLRSMVGLSQAVSVWCDKQRELLEADDPLLATDLLELVMPEADETLRIGQG